MFGADVKTADSFEKKNWGQREMSRTGHRMVWTKILERIWTTWRATSVRFESMNLKSITREGTNNWTNTANANFWDLQIAILFLLHGKCVRFTFTTP